jgi:hypothetical protein
LSAALQVDIAKERVRRERLRRGDSDPASLFAATYWDDAKEFAHDCIIWKPGEGLTPYQDEILEAVPRELRVCGRGPHGLGKTATNAIILLWFATTRDAAKVDWKVVTTAGAWRQLTKFLWPEVHKWARRLNWQKIGREPFTAHELLQLSLKLNHGEAFAVASHNPYLIEGAHADQLLYIFDESKAIAEATFDAAEGAFSNTGATDKTQAFAVAMSTPGEPLGRFYDIQSRKPGFEDWWVRAVKFEEVVTAGRATWEWAEQRKRQWGEKSALYQNRVLGKFASSDEQSVIPLSWVELANERWQALEDTGQLATLPLTSVGVDVGDTGDETALALVSGQVVKEVQHYAKEELMATVGNVLKVVRGKAVRAVVDVIGIGAGVVSRLREIKAEAEAKGNATRTAPYEIVPFHASGGSDRTDESGEMGFLNLRAEVWWHMRERLDPANGYEVALPPDDKLIGDLVAPRYKVTSQSKYQIEKKDDIKKRLGRSTDTGDAVVMAFYQPPAKAKKRLTFL